MDNGIRDSEFHFMKRYLDTIIQVAIFCAIVYFGVKYIILKSNETFIVEGRVYVDGSAYYCTIGEMSKKRLELLKQAEKLRE